MSSGRPSPPPPPPPAPAPVRVNHTVLEGAPDGWVDEVLVARLPGPDHGPFIHRVLPEPCSHILWMHGDGEGRLAAMGPRTAPVDLDLTRWTVNIVVCFLPEASGAALAAPMSDLADRTVALEEAWGPPARALLETLEAAAADGAEPEALLPLLTDALVRRAGRAAPLDALVVAGCRRIREDGGTTAIGPLAEELGVSDRQLRRLFRRHVGVTPKQYAGLVRFHNVLTRSLDQGTGEWSAVARDLGFSDQPHLVREVQRYAGCTPTKLPGPRPDRADRRS